MERKHVAKHIPDGVRCRGIHNSGGTDIVNKPWGSLSGPWDRQQDSLGRSAGSRGPGAHVTYRS
eukprot:6352964-Pyramimonas_sp.AAC.1